MRRPQAGKRLGRGLNHDTSGFYEKGSAKQRLPFHAPGGSCHALPGVFRKARYSLRPHPLSPRRRKAGGAGDGPCLELAYPQARPISIRSLKFDGPYTDGTKLIPNRSPENKARYAGAVRRLTGLGDELLTNWDETEGADVSAYNECLKSVLDISQWEILAALANLS